MIGTVVTLNEVEQRLCRFIARCRYESNRQANVTNAKQGDQSNEETDLEGVSAELAFCKLFGIYPKNQTNTEIKSASKRQDAEADVILNGKSIDVKATKYQQGKLQAATWKSDNPADYYALMVGEFPSYTFKGFMAGNELIRKERIEPFGRGSAYIARQHELVEL